LYQAKDRDKYVHIFHKTVTIKSALWIRSPLNRAKNFTAGSKYIVLYFDWSSIVDTRSKLGDINFALQQCQ